MKYILRNLIYGGIYTVINLLGMAVSLTAAIFMILWIEDERSYDRFHHRSGDIYQTIATYPMNGKDLFYKSASSPLAVYAKSEIPEIEAMCRVLQSTGNLKYNEKETGIISAVITDPDFFTMFSFPIIEGDSNDLFPDSHSLVISQKTAHVLFGEESPIGKIVYGERQQVFRVTGVMKDMPNNTMVKCDIVSSFEMMYEGNRRENIDNWGRLMLRCFMLLQPNADAEEVAKKVTEIQHANMTTFKMDYRLQPITDHRFYAADGKKSASFQSCRLFSVAVVVLLLIACINYVNLVTARLSKRNKEIFVKKVMGAQKSGLFIYSIAESGLLFFGSLILATGLLAVLFPFFRDLTGKEMAFHLFSFTTLLVFGLTFLFVVFFSGTLPAIHIAFRDPLKSTGYTYIVKKRSAFLRRILVVMQFVSATMLILSAITMNRQLKYMQEMDMGYQRENVLSFNLNEPLWPRYDAMKADILQYSSIKGVTAASQNIMSGAYGAGGWSNPEGNSLMLTFLYTDADFITTMQMELVAGADFSNTSADAAHYILNETAVRETGLEGDPIGQPFSFFYEGTIIGVVKDFVFTNLHNNVGPLALMAPVRPAVVYLRTHAGASAEAIAELEQVWKRHNPDATLNYTFLDAQFDRLYKADIRTKDLFFCFALIAIFVSCLGLFGLVTFSAEAKTKEIGIRKVMGASIASVVSMISKEFLILIGIAIIIAFPFAYYWLTKMLQDFAYRIELSLWIFVLAALITVLFTILTLLWKALKAATANPVESIKTE